MTGRTLQDIHEERIRQRKGLTGKGLIGCITILISLGSAYLAYLWLDDHYRLRRMFFVPKEWPDLVVDILGVLILFVVVQGILTILGTVIWKLTGRDKKVADMMEDLYDKWDEIHY